MADRGWWRDWGRGIAKHDAILTISGPNSLLEFNIDQRIVPGFITLIMKPVDSQGFFSSISEEFRMFLDKIIKINIILLYLWLVVVED